LEESLILIWPPSVIIAYGDSGIINLKGRNIALGGSTHLKVDFYCQSGHQANEKALTSRIRKAKIVSDDIAV
jgi:hypothetical protein